jgi:hypothetical protein
MPKSYKQAEQVIDPARRYQATIETDKGTIEIALDPSRAPRSVNNFVFLAREGFYDGLTRTARSSSSAPSTTATS